MNEHTVSQGDEEKISEIVDDFLSRMGRGEKVDIEEYTKQHPDAANVLLHALPALKAVAESSYGSDRNLDAESASIDPEKVLGDFRIEREIGRGGMGVVYEARQISLGRKVALKVLPFAGMVRENALQRFHNEVRAAAALDHPNIVSVYSVGEERGVHYYAMQLIRGQTWAAVIEQLRALREKSMVLTGESLGVLSSSTDPSSTVPSVDETTPPFSTSEDLAKTTRIELQANVQTLASTGADRHYFLSVAQLGIQAADALQHAHDNGVLHRDIKPSNLMLDGSSNVYVTDFGLARIESDAGMTMTGDLVGTLRYMSPEQALAKRVIIDQRSDVYSLGATIYEMVALRPVFEAANKQELLKQIAFDEPAQLRSLDGSVPNELATIIHQSLAKNPEERYSTASELADDLRAFCQNRPIKAKPPSPLQRASKWAQRHQSFVAATIVALLAVTVALAASTWIVSGQQRQTAEALQQVETSLEEAERQRERADANFRRAQQTVDDFLTNVSENTLLDVPGLQPLRKELLQLATEYYEQFASEHEDDATLQSEVADAWYRLGEIQIALGDQGSAKNAHEKAFALRGSLTSDDPHDVDKQHALAKSHLAIARFLGPHAEKVAELERAIAITKSFSQPQHRGTLGDAYLAMGHTKIRDFKNNGGVEKMEEARIALENAVTVFKDLCSKGHDSRWRILLSRAYMRLGGWYMDMGKEFPEARKYDRKALGILTQLADEEPANLEVQEDLAMVHWRVGEHLRSVEIREELTDRNPSVFYFRARLASSYERIGQMLEDPGKIQKAIDHWKRLSNEHPTERNYEASIGATFQTLGQVYADLERTNQSITAFESAIKYLVESGGYKGELGDAYSGLAEVYDEVGNLDLAIETARKACQLDIEQRKKTKSLHHRGAGAYDYRYLGGLLRKQGNLAGAIEAIAQGIDLLTVAFELDTDVSGMPDTITKAKELLCDLHRDLGVTLYRYEQWQEAIESINQANEMLKRDNAESRMVLAMANWHLGHRDKAKKLFAEGAAWVNVKDRASKEQQRLRTEAEELMGLTEENRKQLVDSFFSNSQRQDASFYMARGAWHEARRDYRLALADLRIAAGKVNSDVSKIAKRRIILLLIRQNLLDDVATELPKDDEPDSSEDFLAAASALAYSRNETKYQWFCERMRQRYAASDITADLVRTCTASSILPEAVDPSSLPLQELERRSKVEAMSREDRYRCAIARAMGQYRSGNTEKAFEAIRQTQSLEDDLRKPSLHARALALTAMCEYKDEQINEAERSLDLATRIIEEHWPKLLNDELGEEWPDWLTAKTLHREAAKLLSKVAH